MRHFKEIFFKYFKSNLLWCGVILGAKIINQMVGLLRLFSWGTLQFGPPKIRNKSSKLRVENFNKMGKDKAKYIHIEDTNKINYNIPSKIHPNLFHFTQEKQYPQAVISVPQGKVIGTFTNITPDHYILWDCANYLHEGLYSNPYTYYPYLGSYKEKHGNIALISGNDTYKNYNHRMTFALPKFYLLKKSGLQIDRYLTDTTMHFHRESLEILNITPSQILESKQNQYIQCDKLFLATTTTISNNMPQWALHFIRELFLPQSKNYKADKRLYIARETTRKIKNENQIRGLLEKEGFQRVVLDKMSIKEQASLFHDAKIIVGPHGAGLTNLIFCQPGTKVIELFHEKTIFGHYFCLSQSCGLDYSYIIGDVDNTQTDKIQMDRDMFISLEKIKNKLQKKL